MSVPSPRSNNAHYVSPDGRRRAGVALVVVLAFVVLLTGLIVAYFARSMTSRQLSNSSAGQTKSAMLAQSASDIVIAGLKKEIAAGSTVTTYGTSPNQSNVYVPTASANAVALRYPSPAPSPTPELIPNLVRRSMASDGAIPTPAVSSLASAVNSANDPAIGGRKITPARWNSHYLIPRAAGSADSSSVPDPAVAFVPPDWVLMTRSGPAVESSGSASFTGTSAINNPSAANQNYVVGRYAYAIYDEGGLLDMNVAGHPVATTSKAPTSTPPVPTPPTSIPFTITQISQKDSLAMADLTQLPTVRNPSSPDPITAPSEHLAQPMVDSIVGWRNNAAANPTGSFPTFTFTASQASNWFGTFAFNNSGGFLKAYGGPAGSTAQTDQAFLSRQQLLRLRNSVGFSAFALQYMGTFSRSLEQPSFVPAHILYPASSSQEAPSINAVSNTAPPALLSASGAEDKYAGNNDAAGTVGSKSGQDIINPSLLSIRVTQSFIRFDLNQTSAVVGEPLLKTKFPLNRLSEISYSATDSSRSIIDPTFAPKSGNPNPSAKNHIKDWFGLSRTSAASPWTYNHGGTSSSGGVIIMTLDKVAAAGREPDFAELLKASINVGSLAKGGPNLNVNNTANYQYTLDTAVDYNVLQIMANLIDQYDADSYPTIIQIPYLIPLVRTFRGVEDLPYFYRYHPFSVVTRLPIPLLDKGKVVSFTVPGTNSDGTPVTRKPAPCAPLESVPGGLVDAGNAVALYIPEVWNPHDAATQASANTGRPTRFRLSVITDDPALPTPQTPMWQTGLKAQMNADWYDDIPPKASIPTVVRGLSDPAQAASSTNPATDCTAFTFSDDSGKLFREPTLLWRANYPTNIGLVPDPGSMAGPFTDVNTSITYYGVQIGQCGISYTGTVSHTTYPANPQSTTDQYIFQASAASVVNTKPAKANLHYTFRLQYQDPNDSTGKTWTTYDEKYPDIHGLYQSTLIVNKADFPNNKYWNMLQKAGGGTDQLSDTASGYDPRVARFGITTADETTEGVEPQESVAAANWGSGSAASCLALGSSNFTVFYTQRAFSDLGNKEKYANPCMTSNPGKSSQMRWFSGNGFSASNGEDGAPLLWAGVLFGQNDPSIAIPERKSGAITQHLYYEDADGVARRAMGAYAYSYNAVSSGVTTPGALPPTGTYSNTEGLPLAWADYVVNGVVTTATAQNLSRPLIINRPFRNAGEMSYASRGTPWKQIDFFTPESGDTALLDVFCINEVPSDIVMAGKVNLNTHQIPVLQAIVAQATRDELSNTSAPPNYALPPLTSTEAANVASKLVSITTDQANAWRGPLMNIGDMVGRYMTGNYSSPAIDRYSFNETITGKQYNYAGLSPALDMTVFTTTTNQKQTYRIQRLHESAIRALAASGQTRVWNVMIDVVAQTGRYTPNAVTLAQFAVDGESRYWVHVAIDRYTGEIIDKQIELVSE